MMWKKMRLLLVANLVFVSGLASVYAQADSVKLYHTDADVQVEFANVLKEAQKEGKQVLLQIGGNWCKWCIRFDRFCVQDAKIDSMLHAAYVTLHVNYSKENKNLEFLAGLDYPQRFGFPVFVIVDSTGHRLHTQNSWYLEDGKDSYDPKKVFSFLEDWSVEALRPGQYKE
jgi:thioredoxin-related protein